MKTATVLLALLMTGLCATALLAGPPLPGVYKSTDLGGTVSTGRYTEGWASGGGALLPGTTLNAESWNGTALGTEWRYWCATELTPGICVLKNVDANGNGNKTYMKNFVGGYIWLSGTGPWANGDPDYPGVIDTYFEFETVMFQNWVPIAAVTNVQATAQFDNYAPTCMTFYVGNGTRVGTTDLGGVKPPNYPGFLAAGTCAPVLTQGAWWDMLTMTLSISGSGCTVPVTETTWGSLKSIYK